MAVRGLCSFDDVAEAMGLRGLAKAFPDDAPTERDLQAACMQGGNTLLPGPAVIDTGELQALQI